MNCGTVFDPQPTEFLDRRGAKARVNLALARLTKTAFLDEEVLYDCPTPDVLTTEIFIDNTKYWRREPDEEEEFLEWEEAKSRGYKQTFKSPKGVDRKHWEYIVETVQRCCEILSPRIVCLDNEPGNTLNADRRLWVDRSQGYISPEFAEFQYLLAGTLSQNYSICGPALESETYESLDEQFQCSLGPYLRFCDHLAVNWYLTPWAGQSPLDWANKAKKDIERWSKTHSVGGKPLIVTELNHSSIPENRRFEFFLAAMDVFDGNMYWHDWNSQDWGTEQSVNVDI